MKKNAVSFIALLTVLFWSARANLVTVDVPPQMLHEPDPDLGFLGKVEYTINAEGNDSVFVSLDIVPSGGGDPLPLEEVSGDVGLVTIVAADADETRQIFFRVRQNPGPGQYTAIITADAAVSGTMAFVESKIQSMSFNDKVTLLAGQGFESDGAGGMPQIWMADGPHGVRSGNATLFPCCSGLACTWDTSLAFLQGLAKGREFRAKGKNCSLGPALNIVYHPQLGRAFEYFSEDPYLAGKMAEADARGVQTCGVIATLKHYVCNNKEDNRYDLSAEVDERSLRELYLEAYRRPVQEGKALGVMGAYNRVNGSFACSNKYLMTDVLRNDWGYRGLVMTDWFAKRDNFQQAALYGIDIIMPERSDYTIANFQTVGEETVDMHARRVIYTNKMIGALEPGYSRTAFQNYLLSDEHRTIARTVGTHGIILARNNGGILPLPQKGARIAVVGPYAGTCRTGGGGSSTVDPIVRISPNQGIQELLQGVGTGASTITNNVNDCDYAVVFVGVSGEGEGSDRPQLDLADGNDAAQAALNAKPDNTIVVFTGGSACTEGAWSNAPAIVIMFYPGQEQGHCIADVLFGNYNPGGKLPVTFPRTAAQTPNFELVNDNLYYPNADTAHGYFRVDKTGQAPLFHFGHGLSYTTFEYSGLSVYPENIAAGDRVYVGLDVKNTGALAGEEVVQLYVSKSADKGVPMRVQDLRGFKKVALEPGETKKVLFALGPNDMAYFDTEGEEFGGDGGWKVLSGAYKVRAGTSSQIDLEPTIESSFTVQ
jgi:beta-glucosidase